MASSGVLPAGTTSYTSTLAAGTADEVEFPDRYEHISVSNGGTTGVLYVRTDGQPATESGENSYMVLPGQYQVFANALPLWYPSSRVLQQGVNQFGDGGDVTGQENPGLVTPMESLAGQMANPGTYVSIVSSSANAYTVAAAG